MKLLAAPAVSIALLAGAWWQFRAPVGPTDLGNFHRRAADAISTIPYRVGAWDGTDGAVPPAAQALLRPNAMFARQYLSSRTGEWAKLVVIQTRDPRDMSGHYPPNCYAGSGWTSSATPLARDFNIGGVSIPVVEYEFMRTADAPRIVIYNWFILPGRGLRRDMPAVRRATGDFRTRAYGAAQVQVIVDASMPQARRHEVFAELVEPVLGLVRVMDVDVGRGRP